MKEVIIYLHHIFKKVSDLEHMKAYGAQSKTF